MCASALHHSPSPFCISLVLCPFDSHRTGSTPQWTNEAAACKQPLLSNTLQAFSLLRFSCRLGIGPVLSPKLTHLSHCPRQAPVQKLGNVWPNPCLAQGIDEGLQPPKPLWSLEYCLQRFRQDRVIQPEHVQLSRADFRMGTALRASLFVKPSESQVSAYHAAVVNSR